MSIADIANFEGFEAPVWFSQDAITNILSLAETKKEYDITYDDDDFIVHRATRRYSDMVFKPHPSGFHVSILKTLGALQVMRSSRRLQKICRCTPSAKSQVQMLRAISKQGWLILRFPLVPDWKWIVKSNMLKGNPVTSQDVDMALNNWGPSVALLKGKTVRRKAPVARQDMVAVPKEIQQIHSVLLYQFIFSLLTVFHILQL